MDEGRKWGTQYFLSEGTVYEPVYCIENTEITGRDQTKIPLIPNASQNLPVIIYFHRGGWVFGNINEADPVCRKLANHLGCIIVSVDYRLAPENPFPKPLQDCFDATEWTANHIDRFGGNGKNIVVCGESAGGKSCSSCGSNGKK